MSESETLIRPQILRRLAEEASVTTEQADAVLTSLEGLIRASVDGPRVKLKVGVFHGSHRAARQARNPKTGESISVPAKSVISFKASSNTVKIGDS